MSENARDILARYLLTYLDHDGDHESAAYTAADEMLVALTAAGYMVRINFNHLHHTKTDMGDL